MTRPGFLPPGWVVLTNTGGAPLYVDALSVMMVAPSASGSVLQLPGLDYQVPVREPPAEVFHAIADTTRNLPPRGR